jgi:hypothetical protein
MAWLAASLVATGADRGLAVKQPVEVGLGEYEPERCHALVVGISQYRFWPDLRCAASDAVSVASVLRSAYGFKDVRLLLDDQATRRGILEAIDSYTKLGEKDCLLIYYAGHGWMDENRNGFWVPQDAPKDDKFSYVSNSQIVSDYFKKYKVRHLLVMADSCFSGAMLRGGPEQTRPQNWELPAGFRKPSRWILTSGDLAPVPDDSGAGHSPFATRVLQFMKYSDDPAFGVQDLYVYVRKNLESNPICQPLDTPGHMPGGEYVFCRTGAAVEAPMPAPKTGISGPTVFAGRQTAESRLPSSMPRQDDFLKKFFTPPPKSGVDTPASVETAPRETPPPPPPPPPPPVVMDTGTLVVRSPMAGIGTLDGAENFDIAAGGSHTFTGLRRGKHTLRIVGATGTWSKSVTIESGKTTDLIAEFPAVAAPVYAPPTEPKRVRPKAH